MAEETPMSLIEILLLKIEIKAALKERRFRITKDYFEETTSHFVSWQNTHYLHSDTPDRMSFLAPSANIIEDSYRTNRNTKLEHARPRAPIHNSVLRPHRNVCVRSASLRGYSYTEGHLGVIHIYRNCNGSSRVSKTCKQGYLLATDPTAVRLMEMAKRHHSCVWSENARKNDQLEFEQMIAAIIRNTGREYVEHQKRKRTEPHDCNVTKTFITIMCSVFLILRHFVEMFKKYHWTSRALPEYVCDKSKAGPLEEMLVAEDVCKDDENDKDIITLNEVQYGAEHGISLHIISGQEAHGKCRFIQTVARIPICTIIPAGCTDKTASAEFSRSSLVNGFCRCPNVQVQKKSIKNEESPCTVDDQSLPYKNPAKKSYAEEKGNDVENPSSVGGQSLPKGHAKEESCLAGSARTAVTKSSDVGNSDTEEQAISTKEQPAKLEEDGKEENAVATHRLNAASTVPVPCEEDEAFALSNSREDETTKPSSERDDKHKEEDKQNGGEKEERQNTRDDEQRENSKDRGILQIFYTRRLFVSNRPEQFVYMLRAQQMQQHQGLENEMRRLATFANFQPPEGIFIIPLASAGFFLPTDVAANIGSMLDVLKMLLKCAFCSVLVEVRKFLHRTPMDVHKEVSPSCPFVLGQDGRNVSIAQMAQSSGARFLDAYSSTGATGGAPHQGPCELAVDGDSAPPQTAVVTPHLGGKNGAAEKHAFSHPGGVPWAAPQTAVVGHAITAGYQGQGHVGSGSFGDAVTDATAQPFIQPPSFQTATVTPPSASTTPSSNAPPVDSATTTSSVPEAPNSTSGEGEGNGNGSGSAPTQERQVVTYEQLGIFAQRPRRQDMAVTATRIGTFEGWPHGQSHPPSEMAEAGFYYTGQADLVRCFYCRGGLRTWERSDRPWIEHGRWFPKCPFVRLCKGQKFVDAIQRLNENESRTITEADVKNEMKHKEDEERRDRPNVALPLPAPTPKADDENGAVGGRTTIRPNFNVGEGTDIEALSRRLEDENQELKETTLCKMCQQREVNVLFLPCGHLVACAHCAPALRVCAICRQQVKGSVRVLLDEEENINDE